jgi:HAD superfamily hydrolase (TIGR01450 family)
MAPPISIDQLLARYELFLIDGFGVLITASAALPGAADFLRRLRREAKPHLLISNDASRLPSSILARYGQLGLDLPADGILTSGMLLRSQDIAGRRCIVLGTEDSSTYVRDAGGIVVPAADDSADAVIVADDDGYEFLETVNEVITVLLRRSSRGETTRLLLPNPDLLFPRGVDAFGVTAGAIAEMIEAVLRQRDPRRTHRFDRLGKPNPLLFESALARFPGIDRRKVVMIGDQLETDIAGADRAGLDSVFVSTGVGRASDLAVSDVQPTYLLEALTG